VATWRRHFSSRSSANTKAPGSKAGYAAALFQDQTCPAVRDRKFADSSLEGAGCEPSVPRKTPGVLAGLGLLLELAVTNRTRLTRTRHVADRATRRNLLDAATMRGRRYYVKSNMTRQIGEGEIDMLGELGNRRQRPQEL